MAAVKRLSPTRWAIDVFVSRAESPTGELLRHRSRHTLSGGEAEAKKLAAEIEAALRSKGKWTQAYPDSFQVTVTPAQERQRRTLGAALERAWSDPDDGWQLTRSGHRQKANAAEAIQLLGGREVLCTEITRMSFVTLRQELVAKGSSEATITRKLQALYRVLWHAEQAQWIAARPKWKRRQLNNARTFVFTRELELQTLAYLRALDGAHGDVPDAFVLGIDTGLRLNAILSLVGRQVDVARGIIQIAAEQSKNAASGTVLFPARAREVLQRRIAEHGRGKLFPFASAFTVERRMLQAREHLGEGDQFVFHATRHTHGSRLAEAGLPLQHIMDQMLHKTPSMSLRYIHMTASARKEHFMKAMGEALVVPSPGLEPGTPGF